MNGNPNTVPLRGMAVPAMLGFSIGGTRMPRFLCKANTIREKSVYQYVKN